MTIALQLTSVFALAFFSFSAAIPTGLVIGLSPLMVGITTSLSYAAGVALVTLIGDRLRERLLARFGSRLVTNPESRMRRVWDRYGMLGLALLAPMTTGAQVGAVIGLTFGASPRRLILAMSLGAVAWSTVITIVILIGSQAVR